VDLYSTFLVKKTSSALVILVDSKRDCLKKLFLKLSKKDNYLSGYTCYSAVYMRLMTRSPLQSWKWQLIGASQLYRSALCGHLLPALVNNRTRSAAIQTKHSSNQPHDAATP